MLKNKEVRRLLFVEVILLLVFIIMMFMNNYRIYHHYVNKIIDNNNYLLGSIIEKYPELEGELVDIVLKNPNSLKYHDILEKYGLDSYNNLEQVIDLQDLKYHIFSYDLLIMGIFLLGLMIVFYLFIRKFYHKMRGMNEYMNAILNDRYTIDIRSYDEGDLSNLKNDIYKVTVKLKTMSDQSLADKKYLESTLSDISHQIRTPLTSMYVINDLLYDDAIDESVKKEFLAKNRSQLERMEWLVTSLLKLSRLESGTIVLKPKQVNLCKVIHSAVEPIEIPMELKNITLKIDCDENLMVTVDFNWTVEALINIIKNACEHTKEGGIIQISTSDNPIYTEIIIRDNGEGIDSKDIPHVFERFYKGKHNKESIGIGLNMSKKIIEMEKGNIGVQSKLGEYTEFHIKFYKNIL